MLFVLGVLLAAQQDPKPKADDDYNRRLAILTERIDRLVDESAAELLERGSIADVKIKLGESLFNQFTYAFKIVYEEYIGGKRGFTDELQRAQAFLKSMTEAREVPGTWVAKAAHQRLIPRLQSAVAGLILQTGWRCCDGSEQDCITCQVVRKKK